MISSLNQAWCDGYDTAITAAIAELSRTADMLAMKGGCHLDTADGYRNAVRLLESRFDLRSVCDRD